MRPDCVLESGISPPRCCWIQHCSDGGAFELGCSDASVAKSSYYPLHPFLDRRDLVSVSHALVTSRFNYCNMLYMGVSLKKTSSVFQMLYLSCFLESCFTGTSLASIPFHAQFKMLLRTFKAWGTGTKVTEGSFSPAWTGMATEIRRRPADAAIGSSKGASTKERAFSVVAPQLWHSLHREAFMSLTFPPFKRYVKTNLYR